MEPHSVPAWRGALAGSVGYNPLSTLQIGRTLRFDRRRPQGKRGQYDCAQSPAFTKIVKTPGKFERLFEFDLDQSRPLLVALAESAPDLLCRADSSASESPSRSRHLVGDDQYLACRESPESAHPKASLPSDLCVKNQTLFGQMKYEACKCKLGFSF
jgi:hypothetical protein